MARTRRAGHISEDASLRIQLDDRHRIVSEPCCWAVQVLKTNKEKPVWVSCWYYPTLQMAVDAWAERAVREVPDDVTALLTEIERTHETVRQALTGSRENIHGVYLQADRERGAAALE